MFHKLLRKKKTFTNKLSVSFETSSKIVITWEIYLCSIIPIQLLRIQELPQEKKILQQENSTAKLCLVLICMLYVFGLLGDK